MQYLRDFYGGRGGTIIAGNKEESEQQQQQPSRQQQKNKKEGEEELILLGVTKKESSPLLPLSNSNNNSNTMSPSTTSSSASAYQSTTEYHRYTEDNNKNNGTSNGRDDDSYNNNNNHHHHVRKTTTASSSQSSSLAEQHDNDQSSALSSAQMNQQGGDGGDDDEMCHNLEEGSTTNTNRSETWSITDFGGRGPAAVGAGSGQQAVDGERRSRDGSIHVTDEVFNSASHLIAAVLSVLGTALLVTKSSTQVGTIGSSAVWKIVSFSLYGGSLIFLFVCSTLHHAINASPRVENTLRMLDYFAIYPLIAGTFTPMCLVFYHNDVIGWIFISTIWFISFLGMIFTIILFHKIPKWLSMTLYITLGWCGSIMTYWLFPVLGYAGFSLFLLGGILYTVGGYIYTNEMPNPIPGRFGFHEIWHIMVVFAATMHYMMMYFYILPYNSHNNNISNNDENGDDDNADYYYHANR